MPYLMHICFDNSRRLRRRHYLFEYRGVRFKLIQDNPRKWADHLLSIIPDWNQSTREQVFSVASEFLSALSWENSARIAIWEGGGRGWPDGDPLSKAVPNIFTFPRIPFGGNVVGYDIARIPKIETETQRVALTLFREAAASNSDYLSFLFYWQVLETNREHPESVIKRIHRKHRDRLHISQSDLASLPLNGRSLGSYLHDDCRHAIAHITRRPGKKKMELDRAEERTRLAISTRVMKAFAEYYIRHVLNPQEHLYLVRKSPRAFPIFADNQFMAIHSCELAYK